MKRVGRRSTKGVLVLTCVAVLAGLVVEVQARPVRVGRFVEIPYGISSSHPWRTGGGDPMRSARSTVVAPSQPPNQQWVAEVGTGRSHAPAIDEAGMLYVAGQRGLSAVGPDGTVRWTSRGLGSVSGTPSLTPDGHLAVGVPSELMVVGAARVRARSSLRGVLGSPLVLDDGSIVAVASSPSMVVQRVDADGHRMFSSVIRTRPRGAAAQSGGYIAVPIGHELVWMNVQGSVHRRVELGSEIALGPAVASDGAAWVATTDGVVAAIAPSGRVLTRVSLNIEPTFVSNLAVADDGSVRVPTVDAGLVCLGPNGTERWRVEALAPITGGITIDAEGTTLLLRRAPDRLSAVGADGQIRWNVEVGNSGGDAAPVMGADSTIYVATFGGELQAWR